MKKVLILTLKYGKTAAQVALKSLLQNDVIIIPKTTHIERMKENINMTSKSVASYSSYPSGV